MDNDSFDVVIVGASIAGCTAAMLYARRGLRVVLLEAHRDPAHYKRTCTHFIQSSATPTIRRLRLAPAIEAAGGGPNLMHIWTRWGWIRPLREPGSEHGYNVRREILDPLLRASAAAEPGVTLLLGHTVVELLTNGARVTGVVTRSEEGRRAFTGRLVVGADGRHSRVAQLARVPVTERPHGRFLYFAAFENVSLSVPVASQMWMLDPDVVYAFPNHGVTVLSVMPTKDKLAVFRTDVEKSFRRALSRVPDGPDLSRARQVTDLSGVLSYSCVSRRPTAPGLALVGDAALVSDYLWGTGCGFAFRSAEWLVTATVEPLMAGSADLGPALGRYRRQHRTALVGHQMLMSDFAGGRPFNAAERLVLSAAAVDPVSARRLQRFSERDIGPLRFFSPPALARCLVSTRRARAT